MATKAKIAALVRLFAENQVGVDAEAFEIAYDSLLEIGPSVIGFLADIVADADSCYRIVAIDLLECFHPVLDSSAALPSLRNAMKKADPWLRLCAAEAVWIIEGESPKEIDADALAVIRESAALSCESALPEPSDLPQSEFSESSHVKVSEPLHAKLSEPTHPELARVRRRARLSLRTLAELGAT